MKTYMIRINTIDNLYADYIVEAKNLILAKLKIKKAFFKNYPGADKRIRLVKISDSINIDRAKKLIKEVD